MVLLSILGVINPRLVYCGLSEAILINCYKDQCCYKISFDSTVVGAQLYCMVSLRITLDQSSSPLFLMIFSTWPDQQLKLGKILVPSNYCFNLVSSDSFVRLSSSCSPGYSISEKLAFYTWRTVFCSGHLEDRFEFKRACLFPLTSRQVMVLFLYFSSIS